MKIRNTRELHELLEAVDSCERSVWLESVSGERYDLKDELDRFRGIGRLLDDKGEELELFTSSREDETRMIRYFMKCA